MSCYLFVHFRETSTPDGEQVYFALSRDGYNWSEINGGRPVLWAYQGDHGVRDMTVVRDRHTGLIHIFATDLSLSYGMRGKYAHSWKNISLHGSKALGHWVSGDLVSWSEEELVTVADADFGCVWAPDVIYDARNDNYILHWSSSHKSNDFGPKAIYFSRTKDFKFFTPPQRLYGRENCSIIDSAMYEENGLYYMFVKSETQPKNIQLLKSDRPDGGFAPVEAFDEAIKDIEGGLYEAPTAVRLDDGSWNLFLDFYGTSGAGQGYVPWHAPSLASCAFRREDERFSFPYRFKHGTILTISQTEYNRMNTYDWAQWKDGR